VQFSGTIHGLEIQETDRKNVTNINNKIRIPITITLDIKYFLQLLRQQQNLVTGRQEKV